MHAWASAHTHRDRLRELDVRELALRDHDRHAGLDLPAPQRALLLRPQHVHGRHGHRPRRLRGAARPPRRGSCPSGASTTRWPAFTGVDHDTGSAGVLFNPFAAIPSMHVAFALMLGVTMAQHGAPPLGEGAVVGYAPMVTFVVIATANHWWLDGFLGAAVAPVVGGLRARAVRPRAARGVGVERRRGTACRRAGRAAIFRAMSSPPVERPPRPTRAGVPGADAQPPDRVAAHAERDLAHRPRAVRRRRRARLGGGVPARRHRVHRRLGLRHARRPLLADVGQGLAVRRVPGLHARPHRGGHRAHRGRRLLLREATTWPSPPSSSRSWPR